ncbi:hypothetical protein DICVIV_10238 [Dictyocaulus viviparus]|uniref:RNA helicase n=1 Tax=Dictyocaulus viviparus TaxID=29172 RepID=A0A0D8XGG8_DICVI|nr:hypothetical protein DICVIV_10238 [Dictyocaulus viviparus]
MVNFYPAAIESDEEVENDESGEDQDEEIEAVSVVKRKKLSGAASEFSSDFSFDCSLDNDFRQEDTSLEKYLRKEVRSTLEEKIAAMRKHKDSAEVVEAGRNNEVDEVEQLGSQGAVDRLRDRNMVGKKNISEQNTFFKNTLDGNTITFEQMNLSRPILKAITSAGYSEPTPIQAACIPVALCGKDIYACAATGTGKTAAFVLPILERLLYRPGGRPCTRVLVLVPTRELAIQVFQVFRKLSIYSRIEVCLCAG